MTPFSLAQYPARVTGRDGHPPVPVTATPSGGEGSHPTSCRAHGNASADARPLTAPRTPNHHRRVDDRWPDRATRLDVFLADAYHRDQAARRDRLATTPIGLITAAALTEAGVP